MKYLATWILLLLGAFFVGCDSKECSSSVDCEPGQACNNGVCEAMGADTDTDTDTDTNNGGGSIPGPGENLDCSGGRYDSAAGICWQHPKKVEDLDWLSSVDYCDSLILAGQQDWILPGRHDFFELLGGCEEDVLEGSLGYCNSCSASTTCSALLGEDKAVCYWSSTPYELDPNQAWTVQLIDGYVVPADRSTTCSIRCMRYGM